jgi:hypothetical protein
MRVTTTTRKSHVLLFILWDNGGETEDDNCTPFLEGLKARLGPNNDVGPKVRGVMVLGYYVLLNQCHQSNAG